MIKVYLTDKFVFNYFDHENQIATAYLLEIQSNNIKSDVICSLKYMIEACSEHKACNIIISIKNNIYGLYGTIESPLLDEDNGYWKNYVNKLNDLKIIW